MVRRPSPSLLRPAVLLALAVLVAPALLAAATHNFGHRLAVTGRVVDAEGFPVAGAGMTIELQGLDLGSPESTACRSNPCPTRTAASGDYRVFWHAHGQGRGASGTVVVTVGNTTESVPYDVALRWAAVHVRLDEVREDQRDPDTVAAWNRTYTVAGRLWQEKGGLPDRQTTWVDGNTLNRVAVNVTLVLPDGSEVSDRVTTNNYGDFRTTLQADAPFESGTVRIEAQGKTETFPVDPTRRTTIQAVRFPPPPQEPADYTVPLILLGGVGGAIALYFGGKKLKQQREVAKARERSSRKRSNK